MKFTPSSTARRNTRTHSSRSAGGPHTPLPVRRMAPKPSRLAGRSPPRVNVPDAWATVFCAVTSTTVRAKRDRASPRGKLGRMDLDALEELPLTYREVGATAGGVLPAGYDHQHVERQIG